MGATKPTTYESIFTAEAEGGSLATDPGDPDVTNLLYTTEFSFTDGPEFIRSAGITGKRQMQDQIDTFYAAEVTVGLKAQLNESGAIDLVGANGAVLLSFFGVGADHAAGTVTGTPTTTVIALGVGDASALEVGDPIVFDDATLFTTNGRYQLATITAIATDVVTVSPALPSAPVAAQTVHMAAKIYRFADATTDTLWINAFLGDDFKMEFGGQRVTQLDINVPLGEEVTIQAQMRGAGKLGTPTVGVASSIARAAQSATFKQPLVGVRSQVWINGARVLAPSATTDGCVGSFSLSLADEIYTHNCVNGTDTIADSRNGKLTITGSWDEWMRDSDRWTDWRTQDETDDTSFGMLVGAHVTEARASNMMSITIPRLRYTSVGTSEDGVAYKYDVQFEAETPVFTAARNAEAVVRLAFYGAAS